MISDNWFILWLERCPVGRYPLNDEWWTILKVHTFQNCLCLVRLLKNISDLKFCLIYVFILLFEFCYSSLRFWAISARNEIYRNRCKCENRPKSWQMTQLFPKNTHSYVIRADSLLFKAFIIYPNCPNIRPSC